MSLHSVKTNIKYLCALLFGNRVKKLNLSVRTIEETIDYISVPGHSMVRFGDGEFALMNGNNIYEYQKYSEELAQKLKDSIMYTENENLLVCLPETVVDLSRFQRKSQKIWMINFWQNYAAYKSVCKAGYLYGNAFVSRPYMIYSDKKNCDVLFRKLINIFNGKDVVLIEGYYSCSGVGNDLFAGAKSLRRILCPNKNAFEKYDEILATAKSIEKDALVLVAVGPTSKPICVELAKLGYWVLDIGHIDSEYEWFLSGSKTKEKIAFKHTAEMVDDDIVGCNDENYLHSIIKTI